MSSVGGVVPPGPGEHGRWRDLGRAAEREGKKEKESI